MLKKLMPQLSIFNHYNPSSRIIDGEIVIGVAQNPAQVLHLIGIAEKVYIYQDGKIREVNPHKVINYITCPFNAKLVNMRGACCKSNGILLIIMQAYKKKYF